MGLALLHTSTRGELNPRLIGIVTIIKVLFLRRKQTVDLKTVKAWIELEPIPLDIRYLDGKLAMIIFFSRGRKKRNETTCAEERKFFNGARGSSRAIWTVESLVITGTNGVNSSGMAAFINSNALSIC